MGDGINIVHTNRKARHEYEVLETYEAGLVLKGAEVKSLRQGKASFTDAFARVKDGEVWLHNLLHQVLLHNKYKDQLYSIYYSIVSKYQNQKKYLLDLVLESLDH